MISGAAERLESPSTADPSPPTWATNCLNCGTPLPGRFCPMCGQRAAPPRPTLHDLLHDAVHEFAHLDGKIAETLRLLITRPGALTCDALAGRRARYISPLRLYLTCSVIYFLLAAFSPTGGPTISFSARPSAGGVSVRTATATPIDMTDEERAQILAAADQAWPLFRPLIRRGVEDPRGLIRDFLSAWPKALFVLLPVFAGILALFYRHRHFAEHLYFALHLHAFAFFAMCAAALAPFTHSPRLALATGVAVMLWIPTYAHLAFRRVYGDTHLKTMFKETGVAVLYNIAVVPAIIGVTLWVAAHPH